MKILQLIKDFFTPVRIKDKGLEIGSKKKDAKEINLHFTEKHLWLALGLLFMFFVLFYFDILNPIEKTQYVQCGNGTKELYEEGKELYCGENLTQWLINKESSQIDIINFSVGDK